MVLSIIRQASAKGATISRGYIAGAAAYYFCEDPVRLPGVKIFGKTAIPAGTYQVIINRSDRFSKLAGRDVFLPLLLNVPGFEGVRIHVGNRPSETEGCLLVGTAIGPDGASVAYSQVAFKTLFTQMQQAQARGESITITIR